MKTKVVGFEDDGWNKSDNLANHVIVFMLRGIQKNWKQPVAYGFTKATLAPADIVHYIKEIVKMAKWAGMKIVATVCNQGATNRRAINMLIDEMKRLAAIKGEHSDEEIIRIESENIVPLFDAPHLLKSMRNNLLTKHLCFHKDGQQYTAKWDHILNVYLIDKEYNIGVMKKITDVHVVPSKIKKMKVSICSQVFSESTAAALKYSSIFEASSKMNNIRIPPDALQTGAIFGQTF